MLKMDFIGRIGNAKGIKEVKYPNNGTGVRFTVCTEVERKGVKHSFWITAFYRCQPAFIKYIQQGRQIYLRGNYYDEATVQQGGVVHIDRIINVDELEFLSSAQEGAQQGTQQQTKAPAAPVAAAAPASAPKAPIQTSFYNK